MIYIYRRILVVILILSVFKTVKAQEFSFAMTSDTILIMSSTTDYLSSELVNISSDTCTIDIIRIENDIYSNWQSALCADVCHPAFVDSMRVKIAPGVTQEFKMYFYVMGTTSDTSHTKILFKNFNDTTDFILQDYYAIIDPLLHVDESLFSQIDIQVYPNPAADMTILTFPNKNETNYKLTLFDLNGKLVKLISNIKTNMVIIEREKLKSGLYYFQLSSNNRSSPGRIYFK